MIKNKSVTRGGVLVPCGRCYSCIARRVSHWSFRLMQEDKVSLSSFFITLTYDDDNVPITRAGYMDLSSRNLQLFIKKLRKLHSSYGKFQLPLKYFAVGEYGGRFSRPHYHIIVFNAELELMLDPKIITAWKAGTIKMEGKDPYKIAQWTHGHVTIGTVSEASVGYTMKYISKPSRVPEHRNDDRTPEFSRSSKGLGISYLTKAMVQWHHSELEKRQYCNLKDGKKISLPRYYKLKLMDLQERENTRAWNVLESMKEQQKLENTSRERSESYYAGLNRISKNYQKGQKL